MERDELRLIGGITATAGLLAAEHWFPWWRELHRLTAYSLGTLAIIVGQGIYLGFDERWRRLSAIAISGGAVVMMAWGYDALAKERATAAAGVGDGQPDARHD